MTLTEAGTEKVIEFIDGHFDFFPDELEGPLAPQTYRAHPGFWLRVFDIPSPYDRSQGIPPHYVRDVLAERPRDKQPTQPVPAPTSLAWLGPLSCF